jgi:hypothetical protein
MNAKRKELMIFKKSSRIFPIRVHSPLSALGSDSLLSRGLKPMNAKPLTKFPALLELYSSSSSAFIRVHPRLDSLLFGCSPAAL